MQLIINVSVDEQPHVLELLARLRQAGRDHGATTADNVTQLDAKRRQA